MFKEYVAAGYPILAVKTYEPDRALSVLAQQVKEQYTCSSWDVEQGIREITFTDTDIVLKSGQAAQNPLEPIKWLLAAKKDSILFVWNYHRFLASQTAIGIIQALQNARDEWKSSGKAFVILCPSIDIPAEIEKSIALIDFDLPDRSELERTLRVISNDAKIDYPVDADTILDVASGLTQFEAENAFSLSFATKGRVDREIVESEKLQAVRKSGLLELYPAVPESEIGGLQPLRKYLHNRRRGFYETDIPKPKGILLVGPPGSGKSLTAKITASVLGFPLIRFDISSMKGSKVGESEARMRQALALIDAVSPCIVWIEEVEKALGGVQSSAKSDSGTTSAMFGYLLTWMQESKKPKYICATANDMEDLMAISQGALLRRFDDIFFIDLPSAAERVEILSIMNKRYKTNIPDNYITRMDGWTGAEIEKFVIASIYDGPEDAFVNIKPVYYQNREAIEKARDWSKANARPANSDGPYTAKTTKRKLYRKEE